MERKESRDNSRASKVAEVASIQKIFSLNSLAEVVVDNLEVASNISSSTLDSTNRVIKMLNSSKKKIYLRTLM